MVGGVAISLTYGLDIKETDDPHVKRAERGVGSIIDLTASGIYLVDLLPILRDVPSWVPGTAFQKKAKVLRKVQEDFLHTPYAETIRNIVRVLCQKIVRISDLTVDRLLEVLSPRLWWMLSAISTRMEIWRISKPSSRRLQALSSSVGHLFSYPH